MKKKLLLIAGCSHAAGSEIDGNEDSPYNRTKSFGGMLALHMGYRPYNISLNGSANGSIARSVLNFFDKKYNPDEMDVYALIVWTESTRLEIPWDRISWYDTSSKNPDWFDQSCRHFLRINLGYEGMGKDEQEATSYFQRFVVKNTTFMEMMSVNYVLQVQYLLKSLNIPYVMCNAMHMFTLPNRHLQFYTDLIDKTKYFNWDNNEESFFWKYRNAGYENPKAKYWHHNEIPHGLYANELLKFIGNTNVNNQSV